MECDVTIKIKMAARKGNLVSGEASESDEEYEINQSYFMKNTMVVNEESTPRTSGIVVEGEASESDEEETEEGEDMPNNKSDVESILTEAKEDRSKEMTDEQTSRKVKFHYDSIFHRRLRVSNLELRSGVVENTVGMYNDANNKLHSAVFHLNRSQAAIQEIVSNVTLISGDLQAITESLDKTLSRDFLPTLKMNTTETSNLESAVNS